LLLFISLGIYFFFTSHFVKRILNKGDDDVSFSVSEHDDDDDGVRSGSEETFAEIHGFSIESRTHFLSECCRLAVLAGWPGWSCHQIFPVDRSFL
jgi:hypothetical protein